MCSAAAVVTPPAAHQYVAQKCPAEPGGGTAQRTSLRRGSPWRWQWRAAVVLWHFGFVQQGQRSSHRIRTTRSLLHSECRCRHPGASKCPDHTWSSPRNRPPNPPWLYAWECARSLGFIATQIIECRKRGCGAASSPLSVDAGAVPSRPGPLAAIDAPRCPRDPKSRLRPACVRGARRARVEQGAESAVG